MVDVDQSRLERGIFLVSGWGEIKLLHSPVRMRGYLQSAVTLELPDGVRVIHLDVLFDRELQSWRPGWAGRTRVQTNGYVPGHKNDIFPQQAIERLLLPPFDESQRTADAQCRSRCLFKP